MALAHGSGERASERVQGATAPRSALLGRVDDAERWYVAFAHDDSSDVAVVDGERLAWEQAAERGLTVRAGEQERWPWARPRARLAAASNPVVALRLFGYWPARVWRVTGTPTKSQPVGGPAGGDAGVLLGQFRALSFDAEVPVASAIAGHGAAVVALLGTIARWPRARAQFCIDANDHIGVVSAPHIGRAVARSMLTNRDPKIRKPPPVVEEWLKVNNDVHAVIERTDPNLNLTLHELTRAALRRTGARPGRSGAWKSTAEPFVTAAVIADRLTTTEQQILQRWTTPPLPAEPLDRAAESR